MLQTVNFSFGAWIKTHDSTTKERVKFDEYGRARQVRAEWCWDWVENRLDGNELSAAEMVLAVLAFISNSDKGLLPLHSSKKCTRLDRARSIQQPIIG